MQYTKNIIMQKIYELADESYREFTSALVPGADDIIGVRIPLLRKLAKEIAADDYISYFENACSGKQCFEEKALEGFVIGSIKAETEYILERIRLFVPKIDNWSVNDSFCASLKIAKNNRLVFWDFVLPYCNSDKEFMLRFGVIMLMDYFLTDEYIDRVLTVIGKLRQDGYYAKMGIAWAVATAYTKYPEKTYDFLLEWKVDGNTYNKAIQKMRESYRVSKEDKDKLSKLKKKI